MPELGPEIGATLRETRMRARIDIGEVEMRTKIRAKYLRAIENEEWDLLPGPVYVKSFLRTYGDYLGLDSRLLVDEYKRRYEFAPDAHSRPLSAVKRDRERERERASRGPRAPAVPSWAIILLVLVAAGVALYVIGRGGGSSAKTTNAVTPISTHTTGLSAPAKPVATQTQTTALVPKRATLKLTPTAPVWMCIETPAGTKLIDAVVESSGASIPTLSGSELLVRLGNGDVTVTADGKPFALSPSANPIDLKVTPTKVSVVPQGPTCA
jgi:cytoskeleton protein RodZ